MKISHDQLRAVVANSFSIAEVIRAFGLKGGGSHNHMKKRIREAGIDTSHFPGRGHNNTGDKHVGGPSKRPWAEVLGFHLREYKEPAFRLRRALVESGREYVCDRCRGIPVWQGEELRLQVDHKNGDPLDNRSENLRFLCPNCHSQTENWGNSKGFTDAFTEARQVSAARQRRKFASKCL